MGYLRSDGKFIYLDAPYCEFYIPKYYFESTGGFAEDYGSKIHALGVFDVGIFENDKLKEMKVLNLPTWTDFYVTDSEDRTVNLPNDDGPTECKVLKYMKGEKIMPSSVVEDSSNAESFANFIIKGKIPAIVPYELAITLWINNMILNSASLGVPSVILELILASAYRYKKDPGQKFAHVIGNDPNISQFDYIMQNVRQICQYTSTFTGLTFEDFDSMATTALNRTRSKGTEAYSPIESIIKL